MRIPLDIDSPWPGNISAPAVYISIINYGCLMNNIYHPCMRYIIIINSRAVNITLRRKTPVIRRYIVTAAKRQADTNARS